MRGDQGNEYFLEIFIKVNNCNDFGLNDMRLLLAKVLSVRSSRLRRNKYNNNNKTPVLIIKIKNKFVEILRIYIEEEEEE